MMLEQKRKRLARLCRASVLLALLCVLGAISAFFGAVPFSLSLLGVLLIGCLLPPMDAFLALCAYLLLGGIGLPVFAGMRGGVDVLLGATGGFLLAYPLVAGGLSLLLGHIRAKKERAFWRIFGASVLVLMLCYLCGGMWYAFLYANGDMVRALCVSVVPFVPLDLCKAMLAVWLSLRLQRIAH